MFPHPILVLVLLTSIPPHLLLSLHLSFNSLPFHACPSTFPSVFCATLLFPPSHCPPLHILTNFLSSSKLSFPFLTSSDFLTFIHLSPSFTLFLSPPHRPVWLPAPFRRDSSNCGQGAGRADQRASATWRCAIHSAGHGPTGRTSGRPAQEPHPRGQGQRCPQPHQGTATRDP